MRDWDILVTAHQTAHQPTTTDITYIICENRSSAVISQIWNAFIANNRTLIG